jgi:uncharacterized protein
VGWTIFEGFSRVASGSPQQIIDLIRDRPQGVPLVFDDSTGHQIDVDLRVTPKKSAVEEPRHRGRPRLGVVAREVTLLPRHWDWLNAQPGGASVALRKLVDEARRTKGERDHVRAAQEAAYRFMSAIAGNLPGFEEAIRALFASDRRRFEEAVADWPADVRYYAIKLAFVSAEGSGSNREYLNSATEFPAGAPQPASSPD